MNKIQTLLLVLSCIPGLASANATNNETLSTLQYNVWLDGTKVEGGLGLTADQIVASDADIISLIEVKNIEGDFLENLKSELKARGQHFYGSLAGSAKDADPAVTARYFDDDSLANPIRDADTAILSRYPVLEQTLVYRTEENSIVRSLIDRDGLKLAVYSVHLEYRFYASNLPRGYASGGGQYGGWNMIDQNQDGKPDPVTDPAVIRQENIESTRPEAIQKLIADAEKLLKQGIPVIVMGDFNEPSALDWTEATANMYGHNGLVYRWDTTANLMDSGYIDSYRELYPDPVTHPGFTWPAGAKGITGERKKTTWTPLSDERDRIDFTFYKGKQLKAIDAWLVGTPVVLVRNEFTDESKLMKDKFSQSADAPWPSDHRAVQTVFKLTK